ncbi:cell division protein ZipA C-terminal FtsZ-binding domain-containing protein [Sphaerotilus uruguayifluvii]|uniref:Cell division protein ZipA n=1 Tax=Sphaerotilus uruguayifluvii TaxID=2735897 RepID=A0ABX2G7K0_9BURK|nr:cell division protein ZipA C-terminal FtsZ-binding domain-containing protein [Leptothrix sp. C29]NRT57726.1 hypothetical protein [Leptothrix sp. C29]
MNSLQLWLAIIGGLVLAGVIGHGAWQTRRASGRGRPASAPAPAPAVPAEPDTTPLPRPEEIDPVSLRTVPMAHEPSFAPEPAATQPAVFDSLPREIPMPVAPVAVEPPAPIEQRLAEVPAALVQPPRRQSTSARIDALIDSVVEMLPDEPLPGEQVLAHVPPSRRAGSKPFLIEARPVGGGDWEAPLASARYDALRAGLQMVNRSGPINEIEYSEFVQKIQACADSLGAAVRFPDMLEVVGQARALDHIAVNHDAQLAMRLHARRGSWPLSWVQQHASRHGFVNGPTPGRLVLPGRGEAAPAVLELSLDAQAALADDPGNVWVDEMSLVFDVPQTPRQEQPFNAWCASGQALAIALDADVTDDNGQMLNAESFAMIREDLDGLYDKLEEFGLPAGAPVTRRLFS